MNAVDTLFFNIFSLMTVIGLAYMVITLMVAYRYRHANLDNIAGWKALAVLSVMMGVVSGRAQLICLALMVVMAAFFASIGFPKTAAISVVMGVTNLLYHTAAYAVNCSIRRPATA